MPTADDGEAVEMPPEGWRIRLRGAQRELEVVASVPSESWRVEERGDVYELWVPALNELSESDDGLVLELAEPIVTALNGAILLEGWGFGTLTDGGLVFRRADGTAHQFRFAADSAFVIDRASVGSGEPDKHLADLVDLALTDEPVARALLFLQSGTWGGYYGAIDEVQVAVGGEQALEDSGICNPADLKRFKRTANSFGAVRAEARHAARYEPPADPMIRSEARDFVRQLVLAWADSRIAARE